jgi:ATP-dependent helicase/nuclease subunit B
VQTRLLLGPAGSGKTDRCLREIRAALAASPAGLPLIWLAPKQATFQLERQLLSDPSLPGYTRLQILSFERLAAYVLTGLNHVPLPLLDEEGRLMVLRALLVRKQAELRVFRATGRLPGFAKQLSDLLRELQQSQCAPDSLARLAGRADLAVPLNHKLHDLGLLLQAYLDWLATHGLQDSSCLLDLAAEALRAAPPSSAPEKPAFVLGGLWLDGFAEMTAQELDLLTALLPFCERATLAFCLDHLPVDQPSWLSTWSVVGQTFRRLHARLAALPACDMQMEFLPRTGETGRFSGNAVFRHLEQAWTHPAAFPEASEMSGLEKSLRVVACAEAEAEAVVVAREIIQFIRGGGRYREAAVLVRQLDAYHQVLRRVFSRYEIPFFLDRRESIAHHPLAELTRFALRTLAFEWEQDDWLGALKTGLVWADEAEIDLLENEALAHGWRGRTWWSPLNIPAEPELSAQLERLRVQLLPPFLALAEQLWNPRVAGTQLAQALRSFWQRLQIESQLESWPEPAASQGWPAGKSGRPRTGFQASVWRQMNLWLDNLALAFGDEPLTLREWLPILETGLASLTVGVIPPALDQVMIGSVDRARNQDLKLAAVLGFNESVFPAPPSSSALFTDFDREQLSAQGWDLGFAPRQRLGHERYYAYIACTRARERLVITYASKDARDNPLNPSPFLGHLQRLFPRLRMETDETAFCWHTSVHACECLAPRAGLGGAGPGKPAPRLQELARSLPIGLAPTWFSSLHPSPATLDPAMADALYGAVLRTSVSRLEQFAACPFRFFIHSGLLAEERKQFEVDARERGTFQHEVLARFHARVRGQGRQWRDLTPTEAGQEVRAIAADLGRGYREGLFHTTMQNRFIARSLALALQRFIEAVIGWMNIYGFDPVAVELAFGRPRDPLPAWELGLDEQHRLAFRGQIDRVDLAVDPERGQVWCLVMDYKSAEKTLDPVLLAHGLQIQLPAYLAALCQSPEAARFLGVQRLAPAGMFYLNLRGKVEPGHSRNEVLHSGGDEPRQAYRHHGRFRRDILPWIDRRPGVSRGDQFNFAITQDGTPNKTYRDLVEPAEFLALLHEVETALQQMGRAIFAGDVRVDPYQYRSQKACDFCDYRSVCRIDPWTHRYRALRKPAAAE